jgi:hypothetical protein
LHGISQILLLVLATPSPLRKQNRKKAYLSLFFTCFSLNIYFFSGRLSFFGPCITSQDYNFDVTSCARRNGDCCYRDQCEMGEFAYDYVGLETELREAPQNFELRSIRSGDSP